MDGVYFVGQYSSDHRQWNLPDCPRWGNLLVESGCVAHYIRCTQSQLNMYINPRHLVFLWLLASYAASGSVYECFEAKIGVL